MSQDSKIREGVVGGLVEEALDSSEAHLGPDKQEFEVALDQDASESDGNWTATTQIKLILICLAIISIVVALDATILVAALPTLATALNGTANETFWAGSAYLLTSAVFQPILVALSDVLGRREILFAAVVLFTGGSLICCLANNFRLLLTGRAMKGIGGGGVIVMNLIIMTDVIPLRFRPKYNGVSQVAWALGTIIGPIIGGVIAEKTTWRWLFYLNLPFCGIGLLMVPFVVRISRARKSVRAGLLQFDWLGSCLFIASSTALLIGLTWAGHQYPWDSHQTLVPICVGVGGLLFTGLWEVSIAKQPFIRRTMLRDRSLMTAYFCTLLQGLTLYGGIYYLALLLLSVQARKPLNVGLVILPIGCGLVPASTLFGLAISRLGKWRWTVWAGWTLNTLAMGLLILLRTSTSVVAMVFIFLVLGFGQGALLVGHNFAVQALATVEDVASATALFAFMRGLGLCLGVVIGGVVFQNRLATYLSDAGLPTVIAITAESYITELVSLPTMSSQRIAVTQAYSKAFQSLFEVMTVISGLGFILSCTLRSAPLDKILASAHPLLTNIWDAISASAIASLPTTTALASASYAVAASHGLNDDDLTLDLNLSNIRAIGRVATKHDLRLTVDFQDGYGSALEDGIREVIKAGAVSINLEDFGREIGSLYDVDVAVDRIKRALRVAAEEGVPDFVINARSDVLLHGGSVDEAITRGKAYLEAGAWNVFVWGGGKRGGMGRGEVEALSEALGGRLNVSLKRRGLGGLSVRELGEMGVARISVGPGLIGKVVGRIGEEAERIARGEYE